MVAPIDAKQTLTVEGETITLRLNFRALALAKKEGVNILSGKDMDPLDIAVALRCMAAFDHPEMTDEQAFALVIRGGEASGKALAALFEEFSGKSSGGNAPKRAAKKHPLK